MKASCGNLKIPGDDLSSWTVMALVAQPKQVVLSNFSRTAQKFIQSVKKWDILRVYKASAPINWMFEICSKTLLYTLLVEQCFIHHPDNEQFNEFWICAHFLKAKPGHPPSREYKQSMAKHEASSLPGPVKRK